MNARSVHRRCFLAGAAGWPLAQAQPRVTPARIIDTHTHFYDPARPQGVPWPSRSDPVLYRTTLPDRYRKLVAPLGVTGTVVIEASPWLEDNQWVLDLARTNPIIVGFAGHLEPGTPEFPKHLERFRKNRLFLGIRLGGGALAKGLARPEFLSDLQRLADANLELDVLGGPEMLADLARLHDRVPRLRIVIDHLPFGSSADLREWSGRPGVFAKVSGHVENTAALDELWDVFGPQRLVYGSNWPVSERVEPYAAALQVVREYFAGKGQAASDRFFWRNSLAAYRWVER